MSYGLSSPLSGARLLLTLPQFPQDPASGAARNTRTIGEMLAGAGVEVHAVATTAGEGYGVLNYKSFLQDLGITPEVHSGRSKNRVRPEITFVERGIHYHLLDVGPRDMHSWQSVVGAQFDHIFDRALQNFKPDLLLAYGGLPTDVRRYERARSQGAKVVFSLQNDGYLNDAGRLILERTAGVLTPSRYLSKVYADGLGVTSTPLPSPLDLKDVLASERDPIFFTMINPSAEKGLMLMARLAEELSLQRPDIPLMFIESRGSAGKLVAAGLNAGFDLRRHENVMMSPAVAQPREIYAATRVLLVPSLWQEAAGRVAAEAVVNGVPPIVSNRGGLAETCNGGGFCLPVAEDVTPAFPRPVDKAIVDPWIELMIRLADDEAFYQTASEKALAAGSIYDPENLVPRYVEYFAEILNSVPRL